MAVESTTCYNQHVHVIFPSLHRDGKLLAVVSAFFRRSNGHYNETPRGSSAKFSARNQAVLLVTHPSTRTSDRDRYLFSHTQSPNGFEA